MTRNEKLLLEELLRKIGRIANTGSVEDFTVAGIRAELRDALYEFNYPPMGEVLHGSGVGE